jgi:hypothetical protein
VGKDVKLGVVPINEFPVVPNLLGLLYRHGISFRARGWPQPHTRRIGKRVAASIPVAD